MKFNNDDSDFFADVMAAINGSDSKDDAGLKIAEYLQKFQIPVSKDDFRKAASFCTEMVESLVPDFFPNNKALIEQIEANMFRPEVMDSFDFFKSNCLIQLLKENDKDMSIYYVNALSYYVARAKASGGKQVDTQSRKIIFDISQKCKEYGVSDEERDAAIKNGMSVGDSTILASKSDSKGTDSKNPDPKVDTKDSGADSKKADSKITFTPEFIEFIDNFVPSFKYDEELEKLKNVDPDFEKQVSDLLKVPTSFARRSSAECISCLYKNNKEDYFKRAIACKLVDFFGNECQYNLNELVNKFDDISDDISVWLRQGYCDFDALNVIFKDVTGKSLNYIKEQINVQNKQGDKKAPKQGDGKALSQDDNKAQKQGANRTQRRVRNTGVRLYNNILQELDTYIARYQFADFESASEYFYNNFVVNYPDVDLNAHIDYIKNQASQQIKASNGDPVFNPNFVKLDLARAAINGFDQAYYKYYLRLYLADRFMQFGENYFEQVDDKMIDNYVSMCRKSGASTEDINSIIGIYFPGFSYKNTFGEKIGKIRAKIARRMDEKKYNATQNAAKAAAVAKNSLENGDDAFVADAVAFESDSRGMGL